MGGSCTETDLGLLQTLVTRLFLLKIITLGLVFKIIGFFFFLTMVNQIEIIPHMQALLEQNHVNRPTPQKH